MTLRENLIPDDQPYGERQAQKERMQMAGLPTATPRQPPLPGLAARGGAPAGQAPMESGGDIFEEIQPTLPIGAPLPAAFDPVERVIRQMEASPNPVAQEIARRVREESA